jgi:hypothetical protein
MMDGRTAQPVDDYDPDDPVEILRVLPGGFHEQFLAEYDAAVAGARRPEQYRELHHLLRLWRLRAAAYSDPGYAGRLAAMQEAVRSGRRDGTPTEEIVPDWDEKVAAAQRRRAGG